MDFITPDFLDYIMEVEGSRKRRGKHYAYPSPEGGAKTIGYGHKLKKGENFSSGLTENQAKLLLESDLMNAAQGVEKSIGKDWDSLDTKRKQMLIGMQFNLGSVKRKFPKFTEAVINNDTEEMKREYKRYFKPTMDTGKRSYERLNRPEGDTVEFVLEPEKQTTKKKELKSRNEAFFEKFLQGEGDMPQEEGQDMGMTLADSDQEQTAQPEGMHPDAQSEEFGGVEEYLANSDKSKGAIEREYRAMVAKGTKLIHGKKTRENLLRALQSDNPVEAVSSLTVTIVSRVDQAFRKINKDVSDEVKAIAANNLMGQILEVGEASGTVVLEEDEKELAFSLAINKYMDQEIKAGRIDKDMLAEETGRSVANMDPEQRKTLNSQLERINSTAEKSNERYAFKPQHTSILDGGMV